MQKCQNCYWYRPNDNIVRCIDLDRSNWKPIEPENTCKDFILPQDYKPEGVWAEVAKVVEAVDKAIRKEVE